RVFSSVIYFLERGAEKEYTRKRRPECVKNEQLQGEEVYLCRRSHCARTYCKYRQLLSPTVSAIAADCDIPRPGSGRSFVAETSYEPSSVNAHSSHSTNHRSNAIL
ncbi:hypothetical protein ALC60_02215, partial [Trachymyrmex zeteki]